MVTNLYTPLNNLFFFFLRVCHLFIVCSSCNFTMSSIMLLQFYRLTSTLYNYLLLVVFIYIHTSICHLKKKQNMLEREH